MIYGFIILFAAYFFCMMAIMYGFKKIPFFSFGEIKPATRFTVVIPFRNEAKNLPNLLKTIEALDYPSNLFEIIFINDASDDASAAIVSAAIDKSRFKIKLLQNKYVSQSPKKDAISEAIKHSTFEWIVTTDADCELPRNWLNTLDAFIQKNNLVMVCAPVIYKSNGGFIENFQQWDGFSLQTVTIGSFGFGNPLLCNGANLAYSKAAFIRVNGYLGNDHIASGDDIFLFEKMKESFPEKVQFLKSKEVIVSTKPQQTWKNLLNQRIRWASKTSKQKNLVSIFLGILVFLVNASILGLFFLMVFNSENMVIYLSLICFKILTDYAVVHQAASFFDSKIVFWKFLWHPIVYAVIVTIVGFGSFRPNYTWKGRTFENPK